MARRKKKPVAGSRQLTFAEQAPPAPRRETKAQVQARKDVRAAIRKERMAKKLYRESAILMEAAIHELGVGATVDLGRGRTCMLVDNFARRSLVWKPVAFARFGYEILE